MSDSNYLSTRPEWTIDDIKRFDAAIAEIAKRYRLDTYPNQIEIINAEQMLDAYSSVGMPITYHHWSYGKQFVVNEKSYRRGHMGLAYEIVINSNPCIAYLMEENTMAMQAVVIAHACYGHNSFFKNNYLFQTWTNADSIIDYLVFARDFIDQCEERHGLQAVEDLLDSCHALMNYGVDRYKRPPKLSLSEEARRQRERENYLQSQVNDLWRTIPKTEKTKKESIKRFPAEPHENLLYFFEKNAPLLEPWQREIVRIVRKVAQYFYPQRQTKVMNEGWATFWHYTILHDLYDLNLINDSYMIEALKSHTDVIYQPPFHSPHYSGINPYTLGFNIFSEMRRICEDPTEEDKKWFPDLAGTDWLESLDFSMRNFKDESFVRQFLSPKLIREMKLFAVLDDDTKKDLEIADIHNEVGYQHIRNALAEQYNLSSNEPNIQVFDVDLRGHRQLTLRHIRHNRRPLQAASTQEVLKHVYRLWQFPVRLESVDEHNHVVESYQCPDEGKRPAPEKKEDNTHGKK